MASVTSALQRARRAIAERLPQRSQQTTLRELGDERARALVDAYLEAWARADVEALRALLAEDAVASMPPWTTWWRGRDVIADFAKAVEGVCLPTRSVPTRANGHLAVASYGQDPQTRRYVATSVGVFTLDGDRIKEIPSFVTPEIVPRFGLPTALP